MLKHYFTFCLLLLFSVQTQAQNKVVFTITEVPIYTPPQDSLYLIGSFNNWQLADPNTRFKLYPDGLYRLTLDIGDTKEFEYKINRGNWDKVEGNNWGDYLANHRFNYYDTIFEIKMAVASWQDLHDTEYPPIRIIVMSVPKNTPHDASIYIAGTFNDWMDNDPDYKLTKRADGTYFGEIQAGIDSIDFKFTRGSWASIECRWDGGMRSNRTYISQQSYNNMLVAKIEMWQDLSSGLVWWKVVFLTLFIQCIIVLSLLMRYTRSTILILLSALIAIVFILKFIYSDFNHLVLFPKGYYLPPIIYAFIGTWMYTWFKASITKKPLRISYIHFLPLLPLLAFTPYFALSSEEFYLKVVNDELLIFFWGAYAYALILNLIFSYKLNQHITRQIADIPDLIYRFYKAQQNNWYISALIVTGGAIAYWQKLETKLIIDWVENLLWVGIGIVILYYEWFFITNLYTVFTKNKTKQTKEDLGEDSWALLKTKLTNLMIEKSVYTNPLLTLSDLAGYLGTNNHYVSKLINEGFKKSYTDYINTYRVEAFIEAMNTDKNNNTFLYHAYKVGFNSKSAFNRAFKKVTNTTPSDFFAEKK